MTMTPEQKKAVVQAGDGPVLVEDPETHESYVIIKEETYRRLAKTVEVETVDQSFFEYGELDRQPVGVIPETRPASVEEGRMRLLRAAGAWAGDDEEGLDQYLEWNRHQRKVNRPEIEE